jgi:hypothetical protein
MSSWTRSKDSYWKWCMRPSKMRVKYNVYAGVYGEDWRDLHSVDLQETSVYRTTGTEISS